MIIELLIVGLLIGLLTKSLRGHARASFVVALGVVLLLASVAVLAANPVAPWPSP